MTRLPWPSSYTTHAKEYDNTSTFSNCIELFQNSSSRQLQLTQIIQVEIGHSREREMCLKDMKIKIGLRREADFWPTDGYDLTCLRPLPYVHPFTRRTEKPERRSRIEPSPLLCSRQIGLKREKAPFQRSITWGYSTLHSYTGSIYISRQKNRKNKTRKRKEHASFVIIQMLLQWQLSFGVNCTNPFVQTPNVPARLT